MHRLLALPLFIALAGCVTITSSSIGTFAGILPCADCAGILTEVHLYAEQPSGRADRYELTEAYLGARDGTGSSIGTTGPWAVLRGSAADRGAKVIQLEIGPREARRNFLQIGEDELRLLDRNQREIFATIPHSLYRVSDLPPLTLLESDSGRTIEVERGQRVFFVLGANRTTGFDWGLDSPGPLTSLGNPVYAQGTVPGAGGTEIWTFRASGSGKQELVFRYGRPQLRDLPAAKTATYTISVR
jgi:predicted secreted protein/uncharacterized lipoprotein NlpE involved in copper resistance